MKKIRAIFVSGLTIIWIMILVNAILCCSDSYEHHACMEMSTAGTSNLCRERSGGDTHLYNECMDRQIESMTKLNEFITSLENEDGSKILKMLDKLDRCVEQNTDSQNRSDRTKIADCMGLGKPFNSI